MDVHRKFAEAPTFNTYAPDGKKGVHMCALTLAAAAILHLHVRLLQ